ncbi:MAG: tRNA (N(6)-L-threonylcarbamoyladenosine(37)-C(2))-methylthiotransferase MtaB [Clostridia bacterium]
MKVYLHTLGCKVNQCEAESILADMIQNGHFKAKNVEEADIILLSTCAVTNEAERKSRQIARKLSLANPKAKLIICGCASQKEPSQFLNLSEEESIIGTAGKSFLSRIEEKTCMKDLPEEFEEMPKAMPARTRAYIKIQDGCSNFCSYCIIPYLRGKSRSRNLDSIIKEIYEVSKFSSEIVLTGINITDFKINGQFGLLTLLEKIKDIPSRIRLGSLEQSIISKEFLEKIVSMPNFCPHFHLSLQSGSESELERMNRHYSPEEFLEKINLIRSYYPLAAITTDLIVGFPEQTEEEFLETKNFILKCKFYEMHIFPYSKRSGTKAESMKSVCSEDVKKRIMEITKIASKMKLDYQNSCINKEFDLLVEEINGNIVSGKTENYLDAFCETNNAVHGQIIKVLAKQVLPNGMLCSEVKK